jgi:hypothetical protein
MRKNKFENRCSSVILSMTNIKGISHNGKSYLPQQMQRFCTAERPCCNSRQISSLHTCTHLYIYSVPPYNGQTSGEYSTGHLKKRPINNCLIHHHYQATTMKVKPIFIIFKHSVHTSEKPCLHHKDHI